MTAEDVYELLAVFLSSTGVLGVFLTAVLSVMLRRAKQDAEKKRAERVSLELQRMEGEELLSCVVLALIRVNGGTAGQPELEAALQAYNRYLQERRTFRNSIVSDHTAR